MLIVIFVLSFLRNDFKSNADEIKKGYPSTARSGSLRDLGNNSHYGVSFKGFFIPFIFRENNSLINKKILRSNDLNDEHFTDTCSFSFDKKLEKDKFKILTVLIERNGGLNDIIRTVFKYLKINNRSIFNSFNLMMIFKQTVIFNVEQIFSVFSFGTAFDNFSYYLTFSCKKNLLFPKGIRVSYINSNSTSVVNEKQQIVIYLTVVYGVPISSEFSLRGNDSHQSWYLADVLPSNPLIFLKGWGTAGSNNIFQHGGIKNDSFPDDVVGIEHRNKTMTVFSNFVFKKTSVSGQGGFVLDEEQFNNSIQSLNSFFSTFYKTVNHYIDYHFIPFGGALIGINFLSKKKFDNFFSLERYDHFHIPVIFVYFNDIYCFFCRTFDSLIVFAVEVRKKARIFVRVLLNIFYQSLLFITNYFINPISLIIIDFLTDIISFLPFIGAFFEDILNVIRTNIHSIYSNMFIFSFTSNYIKFFYDLGIQYFHNPNESAFDQTIPAGTSQQKDSIIKFFFSSKLVSKTTINKKTTINGTDLEFSTFRIHPDSEYDVIKNNKTFESAQKLQSKTETVEEELSNQCAISFLRSDSPNDSDLLSAIEGYIVSPHKGEGILIYAEEVNLDMLSSNIVLFVGFFVLKTIVDILVFRSIVDQTSSFARYANRISNWCICLHILSDISETSFFLLMALFARVHFFYFFFPVLFKLLLIWGFEVRLLLQLWRQQQQTSTDEDIRLTATKIFRHLYIALTIVPLLLYAFFPTHPWLMILFSFFWTPQIFHHLKGGHWCSFSKKTLLYLTFSKFLFPGYVFLVGGAPSFNDQSNIFRLGLNLILPNVTDYGIETIGLTIMFSMVAQCGLLIVQRSFGPRCFVPGSFFPVVYDYHRSDSGATAAVTECVICLIPIEKDREQRAVTPCNHVFHPGCLSEWMDIKMECPVCRGTLPPFLY